MQRTAVILGAGVMGSAFTVPLADKDFHIRLVGTHLGMRQKRLDIRDWPVRTSRQWFHQYSRFYAQSVG